MYYKISGFIKNTYLGVIFIGILAVLSFVIANTGFIKSLHLSALIVGVCLGVICSTFFIKYKKPLENGVNFSAKRLLRAGIILFGFNVSLSGIINLGFKGIFIAAIMVITIFLIGNFIGIKLLKLDKQTAMLISVGSAVCGAAAVLAMESVLKSESYKSVLAVASVVIFGLIGMFLFPIILNTGIIPFDDMHKGLFLGASLHEVANVVGASGAISSPNNDIVLENAIIIKMIRVILLVPLLFIVAFFMCKNESGGTIYIPWFAVFFLLAIIFTSIVKLPSEILSLIKHISEVLLVFAMIALGLQIDFKRIKQIGKNIFILSIALFIFLAILGFLVVTKL